MGRGDNLRSPNYKYTVEQCLIFDLYQLDSLRSQGFKEFVRSAALGEFTRSILEFYIVDELKAKVICVLANHKDGLELRLLYNFVDRKIEESIPISYQRLISGGLKFYLHCPKCNRRGTKLYLNSQSKRFICRKCGDLTYDSCKESEQLSKFHYILAANGGISAADVKRELNRFKKLRRLIYMPYLIEKPINKRDFMFTTTIKLGKKQNKELNELSRKMDLPKSEIIRRALDKYLEEEIERGLKEKELLEIGKN